MARLIRFWKPYGVLSQFTDAAGRPTLADYVPLTGVYAAGRLDYDSEGLLLLTDDGRLQARLSDPRFKLPKTYLVQVERVPDAAALEALRGGVEYSDGGQIVRAMPAEVQLLATPPDLPARTPPVRYRANVPTAWLRLTISEGRKRQVRRMTAAVGFPTLRLVRVQIGPFTLEGLVPGAWVAVEGEV